MDDLSVLISTILGLLAGLVGGAPLVVALGRVAGGRGGIALGLGAVGVSFLLVHVCVLVVWLLRPSAAVPFGVAAALGLLVAVGIAVDRREP